MIQDGLFKGTNIKSKRFDTCIFSKCRFNRCSFSKSEFTACIFTDCVFDGCYCQSIVIKGIVIGILLVFILVCSSVVALNWEIMDHVIAQAPDISSSETLNSTETVQESIPKQKEIKQKKSNNKKKKSKKKIIESPVYTYVLNTNTGRFHTEDCCYVDTIAEHNKRITQSTREELIFRLDILLVKCVIHKYGDKHIPICLSP